MSVKRGLPVHVSSLIQGNLDITNLLVGGDRGVGARESRGREGYGRQEKKGREAGSLRWREVGEKFKKSSFFFCYCLLPVKETNPTTFLDFHLTFSEA